jgi:hypothetical protein
VPVRLHQPIPVRVVSAPSPSFWSTIFGVASAVAAILALFIAIAAYRKIANERRIVFELEVLRDLLPLVTGPEAFGLPVTALIEALPSDDLPVWRRVLAADTDEEIVAVMDEAGIPADPDLEDRISQAVLTDVMISIATRTRRPGLRWWTRVSWSFIWLAVRHPIKTGKVFMARDHDSSTEEDSDVSD